MLEKIVTDGGLETAAQIEALRTPRLDKGRQGPVNPFEMVAIIVVAVMIASVLRAKYGHRHRGEATGVSAEERRKRCGCATK